jgi:hypothetical protein
LGRAHQAYAIKTQKVINLYRAEHLWRHEEAEMPNRPARKRGRQVPQRPQDIRIDGMPPLPDTTKWQPRNDRTETLQGAFLKRCVALENVIRLRSQLEKEMNIDNYDSGPGIEDIIRDEFRKLLPNRYSVRSGVINDRLGRSAGDCDIIIFNDLWFPAVKAGATDSSRRFHFPIEGVYSVVEVKQSMDFNILDQAMEKLVICHRLHRPQTNANRLIENRDLDDCIHGLTNPLYSAIIATSLKDGIELDEIVDRFFLINTKLRRLEVVRALCVLGYGTVTWGFAYDAVERRPTKFMREDIFAPIFPAYHKVPDIPSALYAFMTDLLLHLYHSVLAAEDIAVAYGPKEFAAKFPTSPEIVLPPEAEWMDKLKYPCRSDETFAKPEKKKKQP